MGLLDSNNMVVTPKKVIGSQSVSFTGSKTIKLTNSGNYKTLCFSITLNPYTEGEKWDCYALIKRDNVSLNSKTAIYEEDGSILPAHFLSSPLLFKNGRYYLDANYAKEISITFADSDSSISKTAEISYIFSDDDIPNERPLSIIYDGVVVIDDANGVYKLKHIYGQSLKTDSFRTEKFKYLFVSVACRSSSGSAASVNFEVEMTKLTREDGNTAMTYNDDSEVILSAERKISAISDWIKVRSEGVGLTLRVTNATIGQKLYVKLFGVR